MAYLATVSYGAVVVSILQDFKADDIQKLIQHSDSKMLFVGPYIWKELQEESLNELTAVLSLKDFTVLRNGEDVEIPSEEALQTAFDAKHPNGAGADNTNLHCSNLR